MSEYWDIFVDAISDEVDVPITGKTRERLISMLTHAKADYGRQHGEDEAEIACIARCKREEKEKAEDGIFEYVQAQIRELDEGPNFFHLLSERQRAALAKLSVLPQAYARKI